MATKLAGPTPPLESCSGKKNLVPEPTVLLLSTSDTDLISARSSGKNYRWANPSRLSDLELTDLLAEASIVVIRILGGYRAWQSGIDTVIAGGVPAVLVSGEQAADAELTDRSTVAAGTALQAHIYLAHGGVDNLRELHAFLCDTVLMTGFGFTPPVATPTWGVLERPDAGKTGPTSRCSTTVPSTWPATPATSRRCAGRSKTPADARCRSTARRSPPRPGGVLERPDAGKNRPDVAVLYYRAQHLAGNTGYVEALCRAIEDAGAGEPAALAATITGRLRGWRSITRQQGDSVEVSAEKGYLREFGNLVFHFALLGLLVAVAVGKLFGYEGNVIVIADGGPGFCSASPAAFDSFRAGNTVDGTSLHPICVRVNNFQAHYLPSGQATSFAADIDYQADPATADLIANSWRPYRLQVNHPLRVGGDRVYLQGHGYAPTFTVTFPDGQTRTSTVQWRPDNPQTLLSAGVVRIDPPAGSYPNPDERRKHQIAIQGLLAPTEQLDGTLLSSRFPALNAPAVAIDIYRGDTGLDSGRPQSLFTLDHRLIEQGRLVKEKRVNLRAGQQVRIDQGPAAGTVVRFDGAVPFVNLQVSHDPGQSWVLVFAITMMAGLLVSLLVRRRRVWARITPTTAGTVNVELGGLTRTDNSGWGAEFERLTGRLLAGFEARSPDMAEAAAGTGRDVD